MQRAGTGAGAGESLSPHQAVCPAQRSALLAPHLCRPHCPKFAATWGSCHPGRCPWCPCVLRTGQSTRKKKRTAELAKQEARRERTG